MNEAIPVVDVMGNSGGGSGGGWGFGEGGWIFAFLIIAVIFGWGRNGCGGNDSGGGGSGISTILPYVMSMNSGGGGHSAAIADGFAMNNLQSGINAIQQGICDATYALNNGINNGFSNVQLGLCQQGHNMSMGFANVQAALSDCCCQTQRGLDGVNFNMAKGLCDLGQVINNSTRDVIEANNANYRGIMDFMVQEKLQSKDATIAALTNQISQLNQNAVLGARIDAATAEILRRTGNDCPTAAYIVNPPTPIQFPQCNSGCNTGCC